MSRIDHVRHAADRTKDNVRHAAEMVAPYAGTAKESAVHYADEARLRLAPKMSSAAIQARTTAMTQYGVHLAPRIGQARAAVPPRVEAAVGTAAKQTARTARQAADYTVPRLEHAVTSALSAAEPVRGEAMARGAAAIAALRSQVTAAEIEKLARKHARRTRTGRLARRLAVLGMVSGAGYATYAWWRKQTNPEWLIEAPEDGDRSSLNGSGSFQDVDALDPEVQAKQAESEASDRAERGDDQV